MKTMNAGERMNGKLELETGSTLRVDVKLCKEQYGNDYLGIVWESIATFLAEHVLEATHVTISISKDNK